MNRRSEYDMPSLRQYAITSTFSHLSLLHDLPISSFSFIIYSSPSSFSSFVSSVNLLFISPPFPQFEFYPDRDCGVFPSVLAIFFSLLFPFVILLSFRGCSSLLHYSAVIFSVCNIDAPWRQNRVTVFGGFHSFLFLKSGILLEDKYDTGKQLELHGGEVRYRTTLLISGLVGKPPLSTWYGYRIVYWFKIFRYHPRRRILITRYSTLYLDLHPIQEISTSDSLYITILHLSNYMHKMPSITLSIRMTDFNEIKLLKKEFVFLHEIRRRQILVDLDARPYSFYTS